MVKNINCSKLPFPPLAHPFVSILSLVHFFIFISRAQNMFLIGNFFKEDCYVDLWAVSLTFQLGFLAMLPSWLFAQGGASRRHAYFLCYGLVFLSLLVRFLTVFYLDIMLDPVGDGEHVSQALLVLPPPALRRMEPLPDGAPHSRRRCLHPLLYPCPHLRPSTAKQVLAAAHAVVAGGGVPDGRAVRLLRARRARQRQPLAA